jgi:protein gp37
MRDDVVFDVLGRRYGVPGQWQAPMSHGIDWVIVGGESGPHARPMREEWVRSLVQQCQAARVPVFVKQMGAVWASEHGVPGKGGDMSQWPEDLRVREFPVAVA